MSAFVAVIILGLLSAALIVSGTYLVAGLGASLLVSGGCIALAARTIAKGLAG